MKLNSFLKLMDENDEVVLLNYKEEVIDSTTAFSVIHNNQYKHLLFKDIMKLWVDVDKYNYPQIYVKLLE